LTSSNTAWATTPSRPPHHPPRRAEIPDLRVSRRHPDPPAGRAERRLRVREGQSSNHRKPQRRPGCRMVIAVVPVR
jgi:hypothetical protein